MSGTLYVVATPIGNLEDITLRALRVLREVSLIAAEDTRRTAKLLHHFSVTTRSVSFHEHNTSRRVPELLERLRNGQSVAVVSDAGTPLLSDPGLELVRACIEARIPIEPVPGPSAPLAALVASGFPAEPLTILGFAPSKSNDRKKWLVELSALPHTVIFFETPHRIHATMAAAAHVLGDRPLLIARELTKLHQELLRGVARQLVERLSNVRGEFTIVVGPEPQTIMSVKDSIDMGRLASEFWQLTNDAAMTRRQAISELSRRYGRPSREIYKTLEHSKGWLP
jgi:16S rRNA (cytidine1402-2'-O)-methyltransferase